MGAEATNRLGVTADGRQITLLANGAELAQVRDYTFSWGTTGLAAGTFDRDLVEVAFDNFDYYELP